MSNLKKYILALVIAFVITIPIASVILTIVFDTVIFLIISTVIYFIVMTFVVKSFNYDKDQCPVVKRLSQAADNGQLQVQFLFGQYNINASQFNGYDAGLRIRR